ncbi:penicillin-binding protein, partial [Streptomyces albidoflavus]
MRSGAKVAVVGGVFVLAAGGIGYGAYRVISDDTGGGTDTVAESTEVKTGPPSETEIEQTSKDLLAAWASGDAATAAQLTNNATAAE